MVLTKVAVCMETQVTDIHVDRVEREQAAVIFLQCRVSQFVCYFMFSLIICSIVLLQQQKT